MITRSIGLSGNTFIDDNHQALLGAYNAIDVSSREQWDKDAFGKCVIAFLAELESHHHHEEMILKAAGFDMLDMHTLRHREIALQARIEGMNIQDFPSASGYMRLLRGLVFSHELFDDQDFWPLFEQGDNRERLIEWSVQYETGDDHVDKHHQALVNYINRLHTRFTETPDLNQAVSELEHLYQYSQFHFDEEEAMLGKQLFPGHKQAHQNLLIDLDKVIAELKQGRHEVQNLGDYLKYWLMNHIQTFDVPSFKAN